MCLARHPRPRECVPYDEALHVVWAPPGEAEPNRPSQSWTMIVGSLEAEVIDEMLDHDAMLALVKP